MNKPIYRHLADQKWREMRRKVVIQRVEQMFVTPDVLPSINAVASVELKFARGTKVQPGQFVDSRLSQYAPVVDIQVFNKGDRLVSIVFVDSDVPNLETDDFEHKCLGMFANLEVGPTSLPMNLSSKKYEETVVLPWTPPTAQKGSPYHRISAWVVEHANNEPLDIEDIKRWMPEMEKTQTQKFSMREFISKTQTKPVGVTMFRTQWDDGMFDVMTRYNIPGANVALKQRLPERLPYKKKDGKRYR
jgi:large subunit ribosomal protein L35